jgi:nucleotide-binding universal stress UspA family protein
MKKIESILVATDLRETSDVVVRAAAAIAALLGARLHVLHALDLDVAPYPSITASSRFDDRIRAAEEALSDQIRRAIPPEVEIASRSALTYLASRAIIEAAQGHEVDLIVMGPHRSRPIADAFLGSTADHVIRTTDIPCLIVRGPLSLPLRQAVIPLDLSEPAKGALDVALSWAAWLGPAAGAAGGTVLTVVHVVPKAFQVPDFSFDREVIGPELHREVAAALGQVGDGLDVREEVLWSDDPDTEIVRFAEQRKADLVVMATHGHGAIKRALIGSVASGVARSATCPVLLVPPGLWQRAGS